MMVSLDWLTDIASNYLKSLVLLGGVEVKLWLNSLERVSIVAIPFRPLIGIDYSTGSQ